MSQLAQLKITQISKLSGLPQPRNSSIAIELLKITAEMKKVPTPNIS